jgi:WD40 repeat protein
MASTDSGTAVARGKTSNSILIWKDHTGMMIPIARAAPFRVLLAQILPRGPTTLV